MCHFLISWRYGAGLAALYIAANGRALDATGVYTIRQALINNGVQQTESRGLFVQNDPDVNEERIGWAGDSGTGSPPIVAWVYPDDGMEVEGSVTIQIGASDDDDAPGTGVEWQMDGGTRQPAIYNSVTGYYEANWESTAVSDGSHTMGTRAADSGNNVSSSNITVTVSNNPSGGPVVAEQTVYVGGEYASHLLLPVAIPDSQTQ